MRFELSEDKYVDSRFHGNDPIRIDDILNNGAGKERIFTADLPEFAKATPGRRTLGVWGVK
ncbi:MAG: hypothetical protein WC454_08965 [Phycisphaerae bacterium]